MVKKFLMVNVIGLPLHFFLWLVIILAIAKIENPSDWFVYSNKFVLYTLWLALLPNVIYLLRHFTVKGIVADFLISTLIVVSGYFVVANLFGFIYHA